MIKKIKKLLKRKYSLPKVGVKTFNFPRLPVNWNVKIPYFKLEGEPKKMLAVGLSATFLGMALAMTFIVAGTDDTPMFPQSADYYAAVHQYAEMEQLTVGEKRVDQTQTLNLITGNARINTIYMENLDIGKASGLNYSLEMFGVEGNDTNYYKCEKLIIDGLVAPKLEIGNATAYTTIVTNNVADGNSFSVTTATVYNHQFGSERGALDIPSIDGGDYDRILLDTTDGNTTCNTITLKDVRSYGAGVILERFQVGTLVINNSVIGDGSGINSASFIIDSSFNSSNTTFNNNVEEPISIA